MKKVRLWGVLLVGMVVILLVGLFIASRWRGPTEEDRNNRRALDAILTAITMKNSRLLEESGERAKARHDERQITDEQYQSIEAFIAKARSGNWSGAEKDGYEFRRKCPFVKEGQ
jgi:hypothetical protein